MENSNLEKTVQSSDQLRTLGDAEHAYKRAMLDFFTVKKQKQELQTLINKVNKEHEESNFDVWVIFIFNLFSGISTGYAVYNVMSTHGSTERVLAGIAAAVVGFLFSFSIERKIINIGFIKEVYNNAKAKNRILIFIGILYYVMVFFLSTATTVMWLGGEISGNSEIEELVSRSNDKLLVIDQNLKLEGSFKTVVSTWVDQYSSLEGKALSGDFTNVPGPGKLKNTFELIRLQLSDFLRLLNDNQKEIELLREDAVNYLSQIKMISLDNNLKVAEKSVEISPLLNKFNSVIFKMQSLSVRSNMIMIANNLDNFISQGGDYDASLKETQEEVLEGSRDLIRNTSRVLVNTAEETKTPKYIPESVSTISVLKSIFTQAMSIFVLWGLVIVVDLVGIMIFLFKIAIYKNDDSAIQQEIEKLKAELAE